MCCVCLSVLAAQPLPQSIVGCGDLNANILHYCSLLVHIPCPIATADIVGMRMRMVAFLVAAGLCQELRSVCRVTVGSFVVVVVVVVVVAGLLV